MTKEQLFCALGEAAADEMPGLAQRASNLGAVRRTRWGVLAACAALVVAAGGLWYARPETPALEVPAAVSGAPRQEVEERLPVLRYGQVAVEADFALAPPEGGRTRALSQTDIVALIGNQAVLDSLGWTDYELSGSVIFRQDGSVWLLLLYGNKGALDHFELSVSPGKLPPTCIAYAESVVNEVEGVEVYADKLDSHTGLSRRISFLNGEVGCRFDLTGEAGTAGAAEEMVSRFLWHALQEGLDLSGITDEGSVPIAPVSQSSVGEPNWED